MDETETTETADTATESQSLDSHAADVIAEIAQEWEDNPPPPEEGDAPEATTEASDSTPSEAEPGEEAPPAADDEKDRGLERLVAREAAVREQEATLKAERAQYDAIRAENEQLRAQLSALPVDFMQDVGVRPYEAIEQAGHDPDHVMRLLLAKKFEKDGKPVPTELRQAIKDAEREFKIRKQDERIANFERQQHAAAFAARVEAGAHEHVKNLGDSKHVPLVAKAAKANPVRVTEEILDEIARDAQSRAGKDPNAALLTFDEAARRVEKRWADMAALFGNPAASTTAPEKMSTQGAQKTNSSVKTPKPAAPPAKPLTKPAAKTVEELEKAAIEEAVQEFRRVESARKAATRG